MLGYVSSTTFREGVCVRGGGGGGSSSVGKARDFWLGCHGFDVGPGRPLPADWVSVSIM